MNGVAQLLPMRYDVFVIVLAFGDGEKLLCCIVLNAEGP